MANLVVHFEIHASDPHGGYLLDPDNNVFGLISPVLSDGTVAMAAGASA